MGRRKNIQAEYFQQIFDISNNLICVLDNDFTLKDVNSAFEKAFRIDRSHAADLNFLTLLGEQNPELKVNIENALQTDEELFFTTSNRISGMNTTIIEWSIKRNQGQSEIICFGINITQHIEEKLQLESSERRF